VSKQVLIIENTAGMSHLKIIITFVVSSFLLTPTFLQEHNYGVKEGLGVCGYRCAIQG
jgi:hypothetical protein